MKRVPLNFRSMKYFRDRGFMVAKVEQQLPIPGKFTKRDCYGIGDLLVCKPGWGIALVQVTGANNIEEHHATAMAAMTTLKIDCMNFVVLNLEHWLSCGGRFIIHGWKKRGPKKERGKPAKRKTWHVTEVEYGCEGEGK